VLGVIVCYGFNKRKAPLKDWFKGLSTFTQGMKEKRQKSYAAYYIIFITVRILLAIDISLVGILNSSLLSIIFLLLVIPSFLFSFRRVYASIWRHLANWLLEFSLLLVAIIAVIEETTGT
jgi:hypothetical protein